MTKKTVQAAIAALLVGGTLMTAPAANALTDEQRVKAKEIIDGAVIGDTVLQCSVIIRPAITTSGQKYYEDFVQIGGAQVDAILGLVNVFTDEWKADQELKTYTVTKIGIAARDICKTPTGEPLLTSKPQPKPTPQPAAEPEKKAEDSFSAKLKGLFGSS